VSVASMLSQAEDLVSDARQLLQHRQADAWFPASQHPPEGVTVLVCRYGYEITLGQLSIEAGNDSKWLIDHSEGRASSLCITHWRPLPEPPGAK
jgi:hypothetical protein